MLKNFIGFRGGVYKSQQVKYIRLVVTNQTNSILCAKYGHEAQRLKKLHMDNTKLENPRCEPIQIVLFLTNNTNWLN